MLCIDYVDEMSVSFLKTGVKNVYRVAAYPSEISKSFFPKNSRSTQYTKGI